MKDKIRLKIKKAIYWFDYHLGYFFVNGNKYDSYMNHLVILKNEIIQLETKLKENEKK